MKIYGIVGWKNSGKTGLMERLVKEITSRGFAVSTLKHAHHVFDVDQKGKDSYRHREAGANEVLLASRNRWALMHELHARPEPTLSVLLARLSPCDLVLIEGYKRDTHPKIEANRLATGQPLIAVSDDSVKAVASDMVLGGLSVPQFDLNDTDAIVDFILRETGLSAPKPSISQPNIQPPKLPDDCFALPAEVDWMPVDDALALLQQRMEPVTGFETVNVCEATGRILATDQIALRANPAAANSTVDGFVAFTGPVKKGLNTRKAGEDIPAGELAIAAQKSLRAPDLALLTGLGVAQVDVRKRLRVGVLSTGDEIVTADGGQSDPSKTYDANRPMLLSLADSWGHMAVDLGHVRNDPVLLKSALNAAADRVDVILTSGGASAGEEDHLSTLLKEAGALTAWRIALKPGRPLVLGQWQNVPVFGLPGNPVAAFVSALVFARPALSVLAGGAWIAPLGFMVPADFAKKKKPGRREYLQAKMTRHGRVVLVQSEGSGRLSSLSWAEGLVELADGPQNIAKGDAVRFIPYSSFGL